MLPDVTYSASTACPKLSFRSIDGGWPSLDCIIDLENIRSIFAISACKSLSEEELDYFGNEPRHRYEREFMALDAEYNFFCLNNATIVGDTGGIVNNKGEFMLESLFPSFRPNALNIVRAHPSFSTCRDYNEYEDDVFVLFDGGGFNNFWHFHIDMLPTVLLPRTFALPGPARFAMPKRRQWHSAALKRLGVEENDIIELPNAFNKFRRIFLFSSIYWPELTIPNSFARKTFQVLKGGSNPTGIEQETYAGRFVYVARTDSAARRLTNEQDLISGLRLLGFDIAIMSDLAYEQQVALFKSSDVIVGLHGAGLTNVIYAKAETLVVEVFPFGILNAPHYNFLCKAIGLSYEMYVSRLRSDVSVHERWTLEVEAFLFRLVCLLSDYQIADRDVLVEQLPPTQKNKNSVALGEEQTLNALFSSNLVTLFGFSGMEPWGRWMCERRGAVRFAFQLPAAFTLRIKVIINIAALSEPLSISCGITRHFVSSSSEEILLHIRNPARHRTIWIDAPGAISPARASSQPTNDARLLSIGIVSLCIEKTPATGAQEA